MEPFLCFNGGTYETNGRRGKGGGRRTPASHTKNVRLACQFLREKHVKVADLDWLNCLEAEKLGRDDAAILDPPYLGGDVGPYDAESICPTELIEHLKAAPFHWVFCEYHQPLYIAAFGEPAFKKEVQLRSTDVDKRRTECIWVHEPNAGRTVTVTVPERSNDAYYKSLSVEALLKEIQECMGSITYHRNQINREMRERLLLALEELRKRTYRKKPGFYDSLAKIGLNADTVRQWFYRSNTADEAIGVLEETPPESARREHSEGQSPETVTVPGVFRVLYVDPPWSYSNPTSKIPVAADHHYKTMELKNICEMKLPRIAENAVLFLWATAPMLKEAMDVISAWGFVYKTNFIWNKMKHNYGHYSSVQHELLLLATRGSCLPDTRKLVGSVVSIRPTQHSAKPVEFREIIDRLYPFGERIELFARGELPAHWRGWGLEYEDFAGASPLSHEVRDRA
jgi:N6-adenosine-specific RNA methylase IME4